MSTKKVGWCRLTEELVLDVEILDIPYLRDDMDVYAVDSRGYWSQWTPESQAFRYTKPSDIPEVVQIAMMMLS